MNLYLYFYLNKECVCAFPTDVFPSVLLYITKYVGYGRGGTITKHVNPFLGLFSSSSSPFLITVSESRCATLVYN